MPHYIVDMNLFSGSVDTFRTAVGGYFSFNLDEAGSYPAEAVMVYGCSPTAPKSPFFRLIEAASGKTHPINERTLFPNYQTPIRIYGDSENILSDEHWKAVIMGGTFGDNSYSAIYKKEVFDDRTFRISMPVSLQEYKNLLASPIGGTPSLGPTPTIDITPKYNYYLPNYQEHIEGLRSELLIPNMNFFQLLSGAYEDFTMGGLYVGGELGALGEFHEDRLYGEFGRDAFSDVIVEPLITMCGDLPDTYAGIMPPIFHLERMLKPPAITPMFVDEWARIDWRLEGDEPVYMEHASNLLHAYLDWAVPTYQATITNAMEEEMIDKIENILVGEGAYDNIMGAMEYNKYKFPFYIDIEIPVMKNDIMEELFDPLAKGGLEHSRIRGSWDLDVNFSQRFLKILKEAFTGELTELSPTPEDFLNYQPVHWTYDTGALTFSSTYEEDNFRSIDFAQMLMYAYNEPLAVNNNCLFLNKLTAPVMAAYDETGVFRHLNSKTAIDYLTSLRKRVVDSSDYSWWDSIAPRDGEFTENPVCKTVTYKSLYESESLADIMAYRIEKINEETGETIQNIWILNSPSRLSSLPGTPIDMIKYYDSQVKYGQKYTYNIYAYVFNVIKKYSLSDIRLTRKIAQDLDTGEVCLEFYDPETMTAASQLYVDRDESLDNELAPTSITTMEASDRYMADLNFNYEPGFRLVEMPIYSKTVNVLDHPPNELKLEPFQLLDDSKTIGFKMYYELNEASLTLPVPITATDLEYETDYKISYTLFPEDKVSAKSVSRPLNVEVFRISQKPTSMTDFDGNLIQTISLNIGDYTLNAPLSEITLAETFRISEAYGYAVPWPYEKEYSYTTAVAYDKIKTNTKYYYVFRVVNGAGVSGKVSIIYEAELVNDGGYLYTIFNTLLPGELTEEKFIEPSTAFKKLLQLQPNISQVILNDELVDYSDYALSQVEALTIGGSEDPIWDQTFKVRLTSKKTSKKIDLNVTYKLRDY